jgi:hypothetical protein
MDKTDEYELKILREIEKMRDSGNGGMPEKQAKQLFHKVLRDKAVGEEFLSRMHNAGYITFSLLKKEAIDSNGIKYLEQYWYFPTAEGLFRLRNLESSKSKGRLKTLGFIATLVFAGIAAWPVVFPPEIPPPTPSTAQPEVIYDSAVALPEVPRPPQPDTSIGLVFKSDSDRHYVSPPKEMKKKAKRH